MQADDAHLLTTGQAARLCSVTPDTVLKWIKKGRLHGARTAGGHYRIARQELESIIESSAGGDGRRSTGGGRDLASLRCWEYLSDRGRVRDECRQCVVYRVEATRCFLMADLNPDVGHARQFCGRSCDDCVYFRRATGLATNVLVVSTDQKLIDRMVDEDCEELAVRFARNAYEASAAIQEFHPAFALVDVETSRNETKDLVECLATDARVPGLRIILIVPSGGTNRTKYKPESELIVLVLEKPVTCRRVADVINGSVFDFPVLEASNL